MNQYNPITEEERQRIIEMYNSGIAPKEIARQVGRSHQGIYKLLNKAGIRKPLERNSVLTEDERKAIYRLATEKKTIVDIAKATGRDRATIKKALLKAGFAPYWLDNPGRPKQPKKQEHVFVKRKKERATSEYGGFTSTRTNAHYYIVKGYQGRFYITCHGTSYSGNVSDHGYDSEADARATLKYMKNLFKREGVKCIDDVQNG